MQSFFGSNRRKFEYCCVHLLHSIPYLYLLACVQYGLSTVPRVAKLLKGIAKRQKQEEVWNNLGRTTNLNPMATALQYSYANLSLLFARYHAKIIPWGHKTADFVALGFQDSDEDEDEEDHEEYRQ